MDAEGEGVIDHLDLEAFLVGGGGEGGGVLGLGCYCEEEGENFER